MVCQEKKQRWTLHRFMVFLLIFCIISIVFGAGFWFFSSSFSLPPNAPQHHQGQEAVSPLLFGSNLQLDTDQISNLNSVKTWLEQLHVRMLRLTGQRDVPLSTFQQIVYMLKDLHITPMVNLHATLDSTIEQSNFAIVNLMTTIFANEPVYYEYGDEEDVVGISANAYTTSWNTTIGQLTQIAPNARFVGPVTYHYDANYLRMFLAGAQPQPYAVSWHEFTCDTSSDNQQCLTKMSQWTSDIANARKIMQTTVGGLFPIMITEWNYAANATPADGKSNDETFMTNWVNQAFQTLIGNNVFASAQYSSKESLTSLMQNSQSSSQQDKAFQAFSTQYQNQVLPPSVATIPATIPTTSSDGIVVDNLNDWSNTLTHTQDLVLDGTYSELFNNDTSRASRKSLNDHEEVVWQQPGGITSFTAVTYFWADEPVSPFDLYTSANGNTWQLAIPEILHDRDAGNWYQYLYILLHLSHVNFVKVRWNNLQGKSWSPQVGRVILTYDTSRTTIDDLNDWSKTFSYTPNLGFDSNYSPLFNGDTSRVTRNGKKTHEEIVWKKNNLTFFEAVAYFWPSEPVSPLSIYTSTDGATWKEATPVIANSPASGGNWLRYTYTLNNLSNANFVKVRWNNTEGQSWSPNLSKVILVS